MQPYTLFLHTAGEDVPSFRVVECANDHDARDRALQELSSSRLATRIEVIVGEREVVVITRGGVAAA